ncbi:hypothetical protein ACFE04_001307 [Oxalis oulophora]
MASSNSCPPFGLSGKYYYNSDDGLSCVRQTSFFEGKAVLNQSVAYSVILGFGAFFAIFTSFLVWLEKRYVGSKHTSEWFNTAGSGRNVKTGLIASVIVSLRVVFSTHKSNEGWRSCFHLCEVFHFRLRSLILPRRPAHDLQQPAVEARC